MYIYKKRHAIIIPFTLVNDTFFPISRQYFYYKFQNRYVEIVSECKFAFSFVVVPNGKVVLIAIW